MPRTDLLDDNPTWFRDAIIYQLHIKAFRDSDGNGIGDFRGLIEKLDYLHDLGITAVWLLPFYPSPLRDDGYDIADYYRVNPSYNTLADFKRFLKAAHARGIRVVTELVLNHTSDQHPWFQRARRSRPGSAYRNYYVWSHTPETYRDARIIFQDFETSNWSWDPVAKAYYWHRFYSHQPDLNFDSPAVQREMLRVIDFWFGLGVDGVRLDAVPYLFEREGTNCENLPETHAFLKKLRAHVDVGFKNRMLLAEANQWPEDAVAYFGEGDECHMAFHFPIMPRMYMALQMEDRFPLVDILDQTPDIPATCQWAIFLRNHDELTLEMVTDEERDYMYRVYAGDPRARINLGIRRRLAPLLGNSRRRIELMNFLLFSLPGTPIIYYGDEIGMGDNYYLGDRDGVRTPMQWSPDRNAGFSRVNPQKLYLPVIIDSEYHYESVNVENQVGNTTSLLWWMRRVIAMRKRLRPLGQGSLEMLFPDNPKVLAFLRTCGDETLLVVVNLSRFAQVARLDLARFAGLALQEVFSHNLYPAIRKDPYVLTLGVHDYYWFRLRPVRHEAPEAELPRLCLRGSTSWKAILAGKAKEQFVEALAGYLPRCRWFRSKARYVSQIELLDAIPVGGGQSSVLLFFRVNYTEGLPEIYLLPLAWLPQAAAESVLQDAPQARIARLDTGDEEGVLFDAVHDENFRNNLLLLIARRRRIKGEKGELTGIPGRRFRSLMEGGEDSLASRVISVEQSNSSILYGDRFFLKIYRQLETGINPDPEITRFLSEKARFERIPPFAGLLEIRPAGREPATIGLLQGYVANQGDAWGFTLDTLSQYIERVLTRQHEGFFVPEPSPSLFDCNDPDLPETMLELIGTFYPEMTALLGRRTAEMHQALTIASSDSPWRAEEFSLLYQRSVYQSMRSLCRRVLQNLSRTLHRLPEGSRAAAERVLSAEKELLQRFARFRERKLAASKIRIHGDYHLGQVLFTGKDFTIIDFEGEPARTLSERRLKRSPLRDVAGMIRSFHYASCVALRRNHAEERSLLEPWLETWYCHVGGAFLGAYRRQLGQTPLVPADTDAMVLMLEAFLLEKAIYELGYELNNRPDWVDIPLRGIEMILGTSGD